MPATEWWSLHSHTQIHSEEWLHKQALKQQSSLPPFPTAKWFPAATYVQGQLAMQRTFRHTSQMELPGGMLKDLQRPFSHPLRAFHISYKRSMPHSMVWSEVERVQHHAGYVANLCCVWDAPMQFCGQRYCPGAPGQIIKEE